MANHALSCHRFLALPHGADQTASILRPGATKLQGPHHRHHSVSLKRSSRASALLEASTVIDLDAMVVEAPMLLALSSDLDWEKSVTELREAAISDLESSPEMGLKRLGALMDGWSHDNMFQSIMQLSLQKGHVRDPEEELGVKIRVEDLRWQAALQAAEELANSVDRRFDWKSEAAELRQRVLDQERVDLEQSLWSMWESSRQGMDEDAECLHDEAMQTHHTDDDSYLSLFPDGTKDSKPAPEHVEKSTSSSNLALEIAGTWWTL